MCNSLSIMNYAEYDEITVELECINKAFEGFRLLWNPIDEASGMPSAAEKVFDFSEYGY